MKDVYTTGDIARLFQVAPRTAGKWIDSGALPGWRIPRGDGRGDRRVLRASVMAFAEKHGIPLDELERCDERAPVLPGVAEAACHVQAV
jgi:hypothetical protein